MSKKRTVKTIWSPASEKAFQTALQALDALKDKLNQNLLEFGKQVVTLVELDSDRAMKELAARGLVPDNVALFLDIGRETTNPELWRLGTDPAKRATCLKRTEQDHWITVGKSVVVDIKDDKPVIETKKISEMTARDGNVAIDPAKHRYRSVEEQVKVLKAYKQAQKRLRWEVRSNGRIKFHQTEWDPVELWDALKSVFASKSLPAGESPA